MSEPDVNADKKASQSTRQQRLKEIETLYRNQIKQIYHDSKEKVQNEQTVPPKKTTDPIRDSAKRIELETKLSPIRPEKGLTHARSSALIGSPSVASRFLGGDGEGRTSLLFRGESTKALEMLRRENQGKELKIRQLSHKCESLVERLSRYLEPGEAQRQLEGLKEYSEGKAQRLENLLKIRNEEMLFKLKMQGASLLKQFGVGKEQLEELKQVNSESALFTLMAKKLKGRLKDIRSRQQESDYEMQKDKILGQQQEERIHYLTETNELLRLAETKLKTRIEDLKGQLGDYIDRLKIAQQQNQNLQSELFRLRKLNEELSSANQKLTAVTKGSHSERSEERRVWEAKEREMKNLLNTYLLERRKAEGLVEEKEEEVEEIRIRQRFLEQENERINRELVRWKERFQWLQREKDTRLRDIQEEKQQLNGQFEEYKSQHNAGITMESRNETEEAMRKLAEYQQAYETIMAELDEERRLMQRAEEQAEDRADRTEREWLERVKRLEREKQEELAEVLSENEGRQLELRSEFERKEQLLAEEMQARMKAMLAEHDKKATEQLISLESENDELKREIENMQRLLDVKESLINVMQNKGGSWQGDK